MDLQGRPSTANTARHVFQVQNHQSMSVGVGTRDANTLTSWAASCVFGVNTNVHRVSRSADKSTAASSRSVDVAHIAVSGVRALSHFGVSLAEVWRIDI